MLIELFMLTEHQLLSASALGTSLCTPPLGNINPVDYARNCGATVASLHVLGKADWHHGVRGMGN